HRSEGFENRRGFQNRPFLLCGRRGSGQGRERGRGLRLRQLRRKEKAPVQGGGQGLPGEQLHAGGTREYRIGGRGGSGSGRDKECSGEGGGGGSSGEASRKEIEERLSASFFSWLLVAFFLT